MNRRRVLIVEDVASLQVVYRTVLSHEGFEVKVAGSASEGLAGFRTERPGIVILDLLLPDRDGLDLLGEFVSAAEWEFRVIVITAHGSVNRAVGAMRAGAFDFLVKPFDEGRLVAAVRNAQVDLHRCSPQPRAASVNANGFEDLVGASPAMRALFERVSQVSPSMSTVFISGETGSGKRVLANAIHRRSNRASAPFVEVACDGSACDTLMAELFGTTDEPGALERSQGGTLYLSDVTRMPQAVQAALLRFLQTSLLPSSGTRDGQEQLDVRLICGARDDPTMAVEGGTFREDLFYRLHVVPLVLPPLRERGDDAILIAQWALARMAEREGKDFTGLSRDTKRALAGHPWPGNVRQLLNVLRDAIVTQPGPQVELQRLPRSFLTSLLPPDATGGAPRRGFEVNRDAAGGAAAHENSAPDGDTIEEAILALARSELPLGKIERRLIEAVIEKCRGSVPRAARELGLSPSTVYRKRETWDKEDG